MNKSSSTDAAVVFSSVSYTYPDAEAPVFSDLTLSLPHGIVSFVGRNATGKSTALLLASGRLLPDSGRVTILDTTTDALVDEADRNRYASFIYQNMEFDTEDPVGELFEFVYEHGHHERKKSDFIDELVKVFELEESLGRRLQNLSKGETQRAILVFSLLYGSKTIMMDEPIFALEDHQKRKALEYVSDFAHRNHVPVYYSLHELDLSRRYADYALLFYKDQRTPLLGPTEEVLSVEYIEDAYRYPAAMLHKREFLFRRRLLRREESSSG